MSDATHRSLGFSNLLAKRGTRTGKRWTKRKRGREKRRRWGRLLHGVLVLLVGADVLAGFLALLAPLALLVFVPPVAVALFAVMPPPAAAANERRKRQNT